jgi:mannose-6-phosphate isomerase-like protein (cupin superfamily)
MNQPHQLSQQNIVLSPIQQALIEQVDDSLYQRLDERYNEFNHHQLVSSYEFAEDWPCWEMHPHGDEVVMLLSGKVSLVLAESEAETRIELSKLGEFFIVPKGVWHTAKTQCNTQLLFITPGQGTQQKPI